MSRTESVEGAEPTVRLRETDTAMVRPQGEAGNPTLLVFSDDWGRHPSSCQHLIGKLLSRYSVFWVNTIGMRAPRWDIATVRRSLEKLRDWTLVRSCQAQPSSQLRVVRPLMWPSFRRRWERWLNRKLLVRSLAPVCRSLSAPPIALTTIPVVADLVGYLPVQSWTYYCVDDFSVWPGLDGGTIREMEGQLVSKVDHVIAVSETLRERLAVVGRPCELLTHGVDLDFWGSAHRERASRVVHGFEPPLVVFWGLIDRRMDTDFVRRLTRDMPCGTVLLVGPVQDPDRDLLRIPRVVHIPPVELEELPAIAAAADVLVMPYADLPVTRAMQPLKLKEYLACDRPVVVRDLPANREWVDCLDLARSAEEFASIVKMRVKQGIPAAQRQARARLAFESWAAKAVQLEQLITGDTRQGSLVRVIRGANQGADV